MSYFHEKAIDIINEMHDAEEPDKLRVLRASIKEVARDQRHACAEAAFEHVGHYEAVLVHESVMNAHMRSADGSDDS